ncbi:hypothetical protein PDIP_17280 [Penicillium digitatum Pd1]|uniref:Alcohol acetyltransferase n=1 Tax=Penicillium digitatum (strain Pd1 / CECT 20795) TaxID=1170230 RepID=K9GHD0_PEND1|nr:hypothetical protein PDIP_17280 [Penicillium digitatum Pd1]EKV20369.1 hypothetical protein PDIP_17280 [Penicillium digitatum Pd1]
MAPRLLNKICLITGTGGSMGRAAALKFAQEGAKIVGCDINTVTDAATIEAVRGLGGEMISMSSCDLTKRENCEQLVDLAIRTYGRIDVLYNNAGIVHMSWLDDGKDDDWYKTIDQELSLVYLLTRVAWPYLKESGASIINVGSANGWIAIRSVPGIAHTAAKAGVISMTRQLAMEGRAHGIRANSISPGLIQTLQTTSLLENPEWASEMTQKIMVGRIGQPEEIAAVASFLASDESSYITAADIRVDGALSDVLELRELFESPERAAISLRNLITGVGPNERRTISREDVGYYNALVIAAVYEIASEHVDVSTTQSFLAPLRQCIGKYPYLNVVVKDKHTEKPAYEAVSSIDLHDHVFIIHEDEASNNGETAKMEKILPAILDRPWPADIPPWRIVVLPLVSPQDSTAKRCFVAFAFSHALGDGMVGVAFHRTFLDAWRQTTSVDKNASFLVTPPSQTLPEPFDTPERLPISWKFLLEPLIAVYLPKFVAKLFGLRASASTLDAGTWIGSPMFFDPAAALQSRVRLLEIEAPLVQKALQTSRSHGSKLTATVHQMVVRALSRAIHSTDVTNFVSGTPVDMRASIGTPGLTWGLFVSGYYDVHPRVPNAKEPGLSEERWTAASLMTQKLAECGARLQDQAIGLLRYVPSIRNWTLSKIGQKRDSSYELSNLLAFDNTGDGTDQKCKVSKMVFSQPGNVTSAPLVFNIISVKGGSLMCTVSWQAGALGVPVEEEMSLVDDICSSIRADFEALTD